MEVRLPTEKLDYLRELTTAWASRSHATHRDFEELTGFLQFASQVIPIACAFIRGLYNFAATFSHSSFAVRRISKAARRDIHWWHAIAPAWNGIRFLSPSRPTIDIYTDASGAKGLSGYLGKDWFAARCPRCLRREHIQVKELFTVIYAILCWGNRFRGHHITFHIDNNAIYNAIRNKSIKSAAAMKLIRHLIALACRLDFSFSSKWLPSSENSIADAASHFAFTRMFSIAPWLNQKPSSKHLQLGGSSKTGITPKPLHFTYGMDSQQAPATHIPPASSNSYFMCSSTIYTTPTDPYYQPQNPQYYPGSQALVATFSPKPLRLTSQQYALSTSTLIFRLQ